MQKKNNSEIFLLHLLELPGQMNDAMTTGSSVPEVMLFINKANDLLQKTTEQPYLEGITVSTSVQFEKAFNGIMSFTKSNKIDLIVMGSHGTSGIEELLIGSNAEKVVRLSEIPVLILKKNINELHFENFVFASDFSEETKQPFEKMIEFAEILTENELENEIVGTIDDNLLVVAVHFDKSEFDAVAQLEELLEETDEEEETKED